MQTWRYTRWDGTQDVEPFTAEDVMRHLAEDLLDDDTLRSSLRRMMQQGAEFPNGRRMMGMQELLDRLRDARTRNLDRYNLGSVLDDIVDKLDQVIDTERQGIQNRLGRDDPGTAPQEPGTGDETSGESDQDGTGDSDGNPAPAGTRSQQGRASTPRGRSPQTPPSGAQQGGGQPGQGPQPGSTDPMFQQIMEGMAKKRLEQLDQLPPDVGGRIRELRDYDFMDPEARQQFEELLQMLQQQMLQSYFKGLQQGLQSLTPEALKEIQQMVRDLNELLEKRRRGEDTQDDFEDFMKKWGEFFPQGLENIDQLAQHMQQQIAAMQNLLNSMTPEMRQQLEDLVDSVFQDGQLQWEMAQLGANLERMYPMRGQPSDLPFSGNEPVTLQEAMKLMGDMNSMDQLERELMQSMRSNDVADIDADEVGRLLGEEARQMTEQMQQLTRMLEEAGLIKRKGNDWELTPRAVRKIGERALEDIFGKLQRNTFGDHAIDRRGVGVERIDETKPYLYGDQFLIDTQRTIMNAIMRDGAGTPVQMQIDDFEVYRTETLTQCATVIMLDMSYSMMMAGRFQAGRKMALALDSLIRTQFPKDKLFVVAFSYFVLSLRPEQLLDSYWVEYGGGTNFQEALRQARVLLNKNKAGTRQIIMITDGQPTTFSSWSGQDDYGWGHRRSPRALEETLREVVRCTKDGIVINTFMMERDRGLSEFVAMMAKLNRGRAFYTSPAHLGDYVLLDYVQNKRKIIH
jgi:uncharacterized protein with von Willebrand factor type A (vWA) domain